MANEREIVEVELTGVAAVFKPVVFRAGSVYVCLLGEDVVTGVAGVGDTPEEAISDWNETLRMRLAEGGEDDEVIKYAKSYLAYLPLPKNVQEFYDQFRPGKPRGE
jgi:hypothetical protein